MDMIEFRDEAEGTETCFKLECGHAFHTKCIVQFLTRTEHKCPSCNQHKTPEQKLEMEGVLRKLLTEVRKDDRLKILRKEHDEVKREYKAVIKQLNTESKEWIHKRAEELKIPEYKKYYQRSVVVILSTAEEVAKERGPKFVAAIKSEKRTDQYRAYGFNIVKSILFGKNYPGYRDWRLRYPRVWVRL
jgi:hypothetical protein